MYKILVQCLLVAVYVVCSIIATEENLSASDNPFQREKQEMLMVEASVIRIKKVKSGLQGTLGISRVYFGQKVPKNKTFTVYCSKFADSSTGGGIYPQIQSGEKGVWLLKATREGLFTPITYPYFGITWPVREKISPRYTQGKALAQAIEKILIADPKDQTRILQSYALNSVPEVSAWAIHYSRPNCS